MSDPQNDAPPGDATQDNSDDPNISSKVTAEPAAAEVRTDVRVPAPEEPAPQPDQGESTQEKPQEPAGDASAPTQGGGDGQAL